MSSPIDSATAIELAGEVAKSSFDATQSISPFNFSKVVSVTRIETDTMQTCHPKIIRSKKYLVFEKIVIAHQRDDNGNLDITPI
jgi:hypothetical protein